MKKTTYSFYDVAQKLYDIDPTKIENASDHFLDFKDGKKKQYRRLHEKTGIPKYAHRNELWEKSFTKDKYIETLFTLYAFSEPFFKKLRLFKEPSFEDIQSITAKCYDFLTNHMSDTLSIEEIEWHHELFILRSALHETEFYNNLRSIFSEYPEITEDMINWFNPKPQKADLYRLKQMNRATSQAHSFEEVSNILEEFSTPYNEKSQVSYIGLCRDHDRLFLLRKYYEAAIELYTTHSATEPDFEKQLLALNEKYRYIISTFLEIRNAEVDDIIHEEFYNSSINVHSDEFTDITQGRIASEIMSDEDTFQEALQEYWDREHRINNPITLTEEEIRETEEALNNFFKHRNE
ncbi:MAG TPA: hypothetical protein DEF30_04620 [Proteiniclasticum sp.]|uniref:hypothetical protein n=1 Tax=Proteiniclasticum sp. TaxID=2053595 RepID=UPI000E8DFAEC|nr:hypothetical protein [Proteiniclasticum sp.]HBW13088.1 hypothetical protein [Proteiniclasticum sp.]